MARGLTINSHTSRPAVSYYVFAVLLLFLVPSFAPGLSLVDWATWFLAAGCLLVLTWPFAFIRGYDVFQPLSFITLSVAIGTTARTFLIFTSEDPEIRFRLLRGRSTEFLLMPSAIVFLATCALVAGYFYQPGARKWMDLQRLFERIDRPWSVWRTTAIIVLLLLAACAGFYLFLQVLALTGPIWENLSAKRFVRIEGSAVEGALGYHRLLMRLSTIAFLLAFTWFVTTRQKLWSLPGLAVIGIGLVAAFPPFFSSARGELLIIPLLALVIWNYGRQRLSLLNVGVFVLVAFVILGFMGVLRATREENFKEALVQTANPALAIELVDNFNFIGTPTVGHIVEAIPRRLPYAYGQTLFLWIYAPIPRQFWPEKPAVTTGQVIADKVFDRSAGMGGAVPPNIISDFYWNFGIAGVVVGMFLFGCALRFLYHNALPHLRTNRMALLLYVLVVFPFTHYTSTGSVSQGVIQTLTLSIPILLMMPLILARRRRAVFARSTATQPV